MTDATPNFSIDVAEVKRFCPAGEVYAKRNIEEKKIPVISCEGPCIRGEVSRLAANIVGEEAPYARCCYAETLLVPHSSMKAWVQEAERVVVIDGCFLSCMGRALANVVDEDRVIHIDTNRLYDRVFGRLSLYRRSRGDADRARAQGRRQDSGAAAAGGSRSVGVVGRHSEFFLLTGYSATGNSTMPLYLEPRDVAAELEAFRSVLIVPCPICPPMSLAMQKKQPFIDLFKHGLNPPAFEEYIRSVRAPLEERGIRTDVFNLRLQCPLMCLWTQGQRDRLRREAKDYEAVLVLGCNSATSTVEETLKDTDCRVIQAMRMKALANATAKVRYPLKIELDMHPLQKIRRVRPRGEAEERPKQNSSKAS